MELDNPFGRGDSPLFTYPFFGEEQLVSLPVPLGTPESTLETLEIVFCICNELLRNESAEAVCYLGASEEGILRAAKGKIEEKLKEMAETAGFKVKFHSSWDSFKSEINQSTPEDVMIQCIDDKDVKMIQGETRGNYYNHFQLMLPFYIEAATPIDTNDPKWSIYLQFNNIDSAVITGLLTAYNYFKFPEGTRVRISQVLILPRYQGNGLGSRLYRSVTESLRSETSECVEICVEDPTDAFERIRGLIDYRECQTRGIFEGSESEIVKEMGKVLKFTPEHSERLLLLHKNLCMVGASSASNKKIKTCSNPTNSATTLLRQQVKRWLLKKYRKDLPENATDRIDRLAELYESEMEEFIEPLIEILQK